MKHLYFRGSRAEIGETSIQKCHIILSGVEEGNCPFGKDNVDLVFLATGGQWPSYNCADEFIPLDFYDMLYLLFYDFQEFSFIGRFITHEHV